MNKAVPILTIQQLEELHTGSLLSRLKRLRELESSALESDWSDEELSQADGTIVFKDSTNWDDAYRDVKSVLSKREHISRGSKEKRQQDAHNRKHR